jgi:hypothetical protein
MNIRHALILAVASVLFLIGCTTTPDERHLERLMRHRSWPRIEQIAKTEVKKREKLLGWPDDASYLPMEHKDKVWGVMAMAGTRKGDAQRVISLMIGDDGAVLAYKRYWEGHEIPQLNQRR